MAAKYGSGITDVPGVRVGHWTDELSMTGCTVVICDYGAVGGVDVRGASPGTRETDLLSPHKRIERINAVLIGGGSAYGLAAADGVMHYLEERGKGFKIGRNTVPIVPAAILFDLSVGDGTIRPSSSEGYLACENSSYGRVETGSVGAGTGATVAKVLGLNSSIKGGIGSSSVFLGDELVVGAIVAVNAIGSIHDPHTGELIAGARDQNNEMISANQALLESGYENKSDLGSNTTIGIIATNAKLSMTEVNQVASVSHDGIALAVRPAHMLGDGDTMFALATDQTENFDLDQIIAAVVQVTSMAVVNAVKTAKSLGGIPSLGECSSGCVL